MVLDGSTLHWVRALGFSFHFSWNFGVISERQYTNALQRYDENVTLGIKNLVPMQTLTYDLITRLIDSESVVARVTWRDPHLISAAFRRLISIASEHIDLAATTIKMLRVDWKQEPPGCMVLRCQNPNCQLEVFGAYLACLHCRLCCLKCAGLYCKRIRNFRPLSHIVYHEKASIYVKDDLSKILNTLDGMRHRACDAGFSMQFIAESEKQVAQLRKSAAQILDNLNIKNSIDASDSIGSPSSDGDAWSPTLEDEASPGALMGSFQALDPPSTPSVEEAQEHYSESSNLPDRATKYEAMERVKRIFHANRKRKRISLAVVEPTTAVSLIHNESTPATSTIARGLACSADSSIKLLRDMIQNCTLQLNTLTEMTELQASEVMRNIHILNQMQELANQLALMTK